MFRTGKPTITEECTALEGRDVYTETRKIPVTEGASVVKVITILRDITDRMRTEEYLLRSQKLESVGILAGGIAHDFNNLLASVMGYIDLAEKYVKPEDKIYRYLEQAGKSCYQAAELTKRLITFSEGGAPLRKMVSVNELFRDPCDIALRGSNVRCDLSLPDDLWPVLADEGQMGQAVHHLVKNAVEAMPGGGVITVRAENRTVTEYDGLPLKEGKYIAWSVEDHGIGIHKGNLSRIFDPYFTTKDRDNTKGMGLGLAICYSVIKRHDGLITVSSEPGSVTIFTVYLPAVVSDEAVMAVTKHRAAGRKTLKGDAVRKGNILVMDDEKIIRDLMKEMLDQIGYDVEVASDGDEAIALYKEAKNSGQPFSMVILDLTIRGGMGGDFTFRQFLQFDPHVNAIATSGYSNDEILMDCGRYGFKGAIPKPFTLDTLKSVLDNVHNE